VRLPHAHALHVHGSSALHRAGAPTKLIGLALYVVCVAATSRYSLPFLGAEAAVLLIAVLVARLPAHLMASRLVVEVPFVAFAALLPFLGGGEHVDAWGLSMSVDGAWAAWGILAKATLCLGASIIVTATTTVPDLLAALSRLRVPKVVVSIAGFMVRYLDLLIAEWRRMRCAMVARGYEPKSLNAAGALANGGAALFVRAHERGERVYGAMLARGYQGATR
jgi:cobalt/nickel transport system permease protein